jgi:uncharacterized protein (TIGR03435 family)
LTGTFDIVLDWRPDDASANDTSSSAPAICTALQEQLGLKLESRRAPVDYLVLDHVEKPSAN